MDIYSGKRGSSILHLINDYLAKEIVANKVSDPMELYYSIWSGTYSYGLEGLSSLAYSALDVALWDALAKSCGVPIYVMLGGSRGTKIRAYRSAIDLNYTTEELVSEITSFKKKGFDAFKIKVGKPNFADDLERIEAVKRVIGDSDTLMVDANRRWTVTESVSKARELERRNISWLEEPIEANMLDAYRYLKEKVGIPIAAGESLYNRSEAIKLISGCVDIIQLDLLRIGGITEWMKLAHMAELGGLPMAPHFSEEIAIQALCATHNAIFLEHLPGSNLHDSGFLINSLKLQNGFALPPDKPGHGIVFNWEKMDALAPGGS